MNTTPQTLYLVVVLFLMCGLISAQDTGKSIIIRNSPADTVLYCNGPVAVAPGIVIENYDVEKPTDGIKVSVVNYNPAEDTLFYAGSQFISAWNNELGNLELTGRGTARELEQAVQQVYYDNKAENPATGLRSISVGLVDADYFPETQHFYRFVSTVDITWWQAKADAADMHYHGLQGYLATITSEGENDFIWSKVNGVGWIGATDEGTEGEWRWDTGPEAGTLFWTGGASGQPVNGLYSNWSNGEPNNLDLEHYAHINQDPNLEEKSWNDLKLGGDGVQGSYYRVQGFIVEFGGMIGDPDIQLSATAVIGINFRQENLVVDFDTVVCGDLSHQLNIISDQNVSVILRAVDENAEVVDESSLKPTVKVQEPGVYRFELETLTENLCNWKDTISISFRQRPLAQLNISEAECVDTSLQLFFTGVVSGEATYEWFSNDTLVNSGINLDSLELNLETGPLSRIIALRVTDEGCTDSVQIPVTVKPKFEIQADKPEGCTPLNVQFSSGAAANGADNFVWSFGSEGTSAEANPVFTFVNTDTTDRIFDVSLRVISAEGCENVGKLENPITVYPAPSADVSFDEAVCYDGAEEIWYSGNAGLRDTFLWHLSDIPSGNIIQNPGRGPGPLSFNLTGKPTADIGLQVISEFGCKSDTIIKTYTRKPQIDMADDTIKGCPPLAAKLSVTNSDQTDQVNYFWDFGNGQISGGSSVEQIFTEANRVYDVSVTAVSSLTGCSDTIFVPGKIFSYPVPDIDIGIDESACYEGSEEIWYRGSAGSGDTFVWDLTALQASEIVENPGTSAGPLVIELPDRPSVDIGLQVIDESGCKSDTLVKTYTRKPVFSLGDDTIKGCPPLDVSLSVSTSDFIDQVNYTWDLGNGRTAEGRSVEQSYIEENRFYDIAVTAVSSLTGCSDTILFNDKIFVYPVPEAAFTISEPVVLISDPEIQFENSSRGATVFDWDFGDGSMGSAIENPVHRFEKIGLMEVSLLAANRFGCTDSAFATVSVAFDRIFPPTAFSPNAADEEDREFRIYSEGIVNDGYKMLIFNRWGEVIFTSESQEEGWDGKMKNGSNAPAGAYFWILEYSDFAGKSHSQKGTVTLLY